MIDFFITFEIQAFTVRKIWIIYVATNPQHYNTPFRSVCIAFFSVITCSTVNRLKVITQTHQFVDKYI